MQKNVSTICNTSIVEIYLQQFVCSTHHVRNVHFHPPSRHTRELRTERGTWTSIIKTNKQSVWLQSCKWSEIKRSKFRSTSCLGPYCSNGWSTVGAFHSSLYVLESTGQPWGHSKWSLEKGGGCLRSPWAVSRRREIVVSSEHSRELLAGWLGSSGAGWFLQDWEQRLSSWDSLTIT